MAVIPSLRINGVSMLPASTEIYAGTGTAEGGISSVLTVSTTSAQTGANTTETDLWTYSLPANTLSADNYGVRITAYLSTGANANAKAINLKFGSTNVVAENSAFNNVNLKLVAEVYRTGASAQLAFGNRGGGNDSFKLTYTTPAEATTGAITIKVTGQNAVAAAGDVVFRGAVVEFLRAGS
jgi:hypothetical protein